MGDSFEVVVDVEATLEEAPRLGAAVIASLAAAGIIDASPTGDHGLSGAGRYLPGPNVGLAVSGPGAPRVGASAQLRLGRLHVTTGRTVFYPVQGQPGPAVCPLCGYPAVLTDAETGEVTGDWQLFDDALADWHDGGPGIVSCPNNGSTITINEWQWQGDWPIAVGHLGFTFWNWPSLHPDFAHRIGDQLGHRVVVTRSKL